MHLLFYALTSLTIFLAISLPAAMLLHRPARVSARRVIAVAQRQQPIGPEGAASNKLQ